MNVPRKRVADLGIGLIGVGASTIFFLRAADFSWLDPLMVAAIVVTLLGATVFRVNAEEAAGDAPERIGVRLREGSTANLPRARIQGMTVGIDSEDSTLNAPDSDIR